MLPNGIRALFLDLDETLLDDDRGMRRAAEQTAIALAARHSDVDARVLTEAYIHDSDGFWASLGAVPTGTDLRSGAEIRVAVWGRALETAGVSKSDTLAIEAASLYASARRATYTLFDDVMPFLEAASNRYRLALLTNGAGDTQREKVRATGLDRFLTEIFVSGEIGFGKPAPEAFSFALVRMGVPAGETAHVGDSLTNDVAGALGSGMTAVWISRRGNRSPTPTGALKISTLAELLA